MKTLYLVLVLFKCVVSFEDNDIQNGGIWSNKLEYDNIKDLYPINNELYNENVPLNLRKTQINIPSHISRYFIQVIENGNKKIKFVGEYIQRKLDIKDNLTTIIESVIKEYEKKLKSFIAYAVRQDCESDVDREYLFLDIVSVSNMVLHNEQRKMLHMIIERKAENTSYTEALLERINIERKNHMRHEMNFLCEKLNICRPYPGFIEYFADFLNDVLKLDDNKLIYSIKTTKGLLEVRTNFFKSFIKEDVFDLINRKIQYLTLNLYNVKESLTAATSVATQRYKLMKKGEHKLKLRVKAVRLLLDIIDKAFAMQTDDMTAITFDTTVKALRLWQTGDRSEIDMVLKLFVEHIVGVLRNYWDLKTREEVMALVDIIVLGRAEDVILEGLLLHGSSFVKADNVLLNI